MYANQKNIVSHLGLCRKCGRIGFLHSFEADYYFTLFYFIGFPMGKHLVLNLCPHCNHYQSFPIKELGSILQLFPSLEENGQVSPGEEKKDEEKAWDPAIKETIDEINRLDEAGEYNKAIELTKKKSEEFPDYFEAQMVMGRYLLTRNKPVSAVKCYLRAIKINPDDVSAKFVVALHYIQTGEPSKAASLLDFMEKPGSKRDAGILISLALAFQEKGEHSQALHYFRIIAKTFPLLVQKDEKFRLAISKSQKKLGDWSPDLPPRSFPFRQLGITLFLILLPVLFFVGLDNYFRNHSPLYVLNSLPVDALLYVPGQEPLTIPGTNRIQVEVPEGTYYVKTWVLGLPKEEILVKIEDDLYSRFFGGHTRILNIAGAAPIAWESVNYSPKNGPIEKNGFRIYIGDRFLSFKNINFVFIDFPEKVWIKQSKPGTRTRIGDMYLEPIDVVKLIIEKRQDIPLDNVFTFLETHLYYSPGKRKLLDYYIELCTEKNYLSRCAAFLEKGPVTKSTPRYWLDAAKRIPRSTL